MTVKNTSAPRPVHNQPQQQASSGTSPEPAGLQYRYGRIGIEAVAASVRYSDAGKPRAESRSAWRIDQRFIESGV